MNKAVLSDRIYLNYNKELKEYLYNILTYKFPSKTDYKEMETYCDIVIHNENILSIPIGRIDLIPDDYMLVDKRTFAPTSFREFQFNLRTYQQEAVNSINDSYILNAYTGSGKSVMAGKIAQNLGQKTLIIVHTAILRDQWVVKLNEMFGVKPGVIGGGKFDIIGPIVVGNIQTLRNRIPQIRNKFGTIILDEVQYVAATTFKNLIDKLTARYKIGMSATLNRKDGKGVLIKDYFSTSIYKVPDVDRLAPTIFMCEIDVPLDSRPMIPWATKLNKLYENSDYLEHIVGLSNALADKGYKALVVADRVDFLNKCSELSKDAILITGIVKERDELLDSQFSILYGTTSIFKEGFDYPALDALVLTTPTNNEPMLEQLLGRVLRPFKDKKPPVVWDMCLKGPLANKQAKTRLNYYTKMGYDVKLINADYTI